MIDKGTRIVCKTGCLQAQEFDYRDWRVIGPIAERYKLRVSFRDCVAWKEGMAIGEMGDTPQLAVALAVIAAQGVK